MTRVKLIYPPQHMPDIPHVALPGLKSALAEEGIDSEVIDANILFYHHFLSERTIRANANAIASKDSGSLDDFVEDVQKASRTLRQPLAFDKLGDYAAARKGIESALEVLVEGYEAHLGLMSSSLYYQYTDSSEVVKAINDPQRNPYISFFRPITEQCLADIVGISIGVPEQIIPAFTLAKQIREVSPQTKIVIGGNTFTRVEDGIRGNNRLAELFDYGISSEADIAFPLLARALLGGRQVSPQELDEWSEAVPDLKKFAAPDFSDLNLTAYFSPMPVLPLLGGRGCYYNKCGFCSITRAYKEGGEFRGKAPEQVFEEARNYHEQFAVRHFKFNEESHHPGFAQKFASLVEQSELPLRFEVFANLEPWLASKDATGQLFRGGYRRLMLGLETVSASVLAAMKKRGEKTIRRQDEIFSSINNSGILVFTFLMVGTPWEKEEDTLATAEYVVNNKDIGNCVVSVYSLDRLAPDVVSEQLHNKFGIGNIKRVGDISCTYAYTVNDKDSKKSNMDRAVSVLKRINEARPDLAFMASLLPAARLVYIDMYGNNFAKRFVAERGAAFAPELANDVYTKARITRRK